MRKTLLVVDDEKLVRWAIQQSMGEENFTVVSAADGEDAIDKIRKETFDVIITDLIMPGLNGLELARMVRDLQPQSKVIMMTSHSELLDKGEAKNAGVQGFIDKPFLVQEVKSVVRQIISGD
jgi:DNA-binding NtrC family response regulator